MSRPEITLDEETHTYSVDGEIFTGPSVTAVIDATVPVPFSAGSWYGYNMAVGGVEVLLRSDVLRNSHTFDVIKTKLKGIGVAPNIRLEEAGERGDIFHRMLEAVGETGEIEIPGHLDEEERPRVQALAAWLLENRPTFLEQEVCTVSLDYDYIGKFDARVRFEAGPHKGAVAMIDLKTSGKKPSDKSKYMGKWFPQLEAYEQAERELGEEPTDFRAVLHLPLTGAAALVRSVDSFQDFKVLLDQYRSQLARRERLKAAKA